jgi:hypothetical protein
MGSPLSMLAAHERWQHDQTEERQVIRASVQAAVAHQALEGLSGVRYESEYLRRRIVT